MTAPDDAWIAAQRRAVVAPLDACGLRYDMHETPSGQPYAAFRWRTDGLPPLICTVILHDGAWRLTAHELGSAGTPGAIAARNGRLPLVRGMSVPGDDGLSAVLSVRIRPSHVTSDDLLDLLVHLGASVAFLQGHSDEPPPLPILGQPHESALRTGPPTELRVEEPAPGWHAVILPAPDFPWTRLFRVPGLLDRLHDWTPVGTLVDRDTMVTARVTTLSANPGLPDAVARAAADARRLLEAARSAC